MRLLCITKGALIRRGIAFSCIMLIAAAFRFPQLSVRPMHCDEAVNADKLGELLEHGEYKYSAVDYHGPTLNYLSWFIARAEGITNYADLNETTLRIIPAIAGILLVGLHIFLVRDLGPIAASSSALLTAVSPAMVYYSRYYIHEMLLVLFSFGFILAVFRYWERRRTVWAAASGICIGLMFSTKETAIIPLASVVLAAVMAGAGKRDHQSANKLPFLLRHLATALTAAAATTAVLISSFFTNPQGIWDFIRAYRQYCLRGMGAGTPHVHPWNYYLILLNYYRAGNGPVFTEAVISILALVGMASAIYEWRRGLRPCTLRLFLAVYGVAMVAAYSFIPYKVPWNLLGFLHGMILLSGIGTAFLAQRLRNSALIVGVALFSVCVASLGWQALRGSFSLSLDPRNPWVYAHTGKDVYAIVQELEILAATYPGGESGLPIAIVSRENLWPLPWYLRRFHRLQWWNGVSDTSAAAPVYLITPDMEPALVRRLYEIPPTGQRDLYVDLFSHYVELRPGVELRGYASLSVWKEL
jgi:uncharacterized protein (TIGR03663 family)